MCGGMSESGPELAGVRALAELLVAPLGDRWLHLQAVGARAEVLAAAVDEPDRALLINAAWLHDIGYSPEIATTGFHPLDGAAHLTALGYPQRLVCLVAHHSSARWEAQELGLADRLAEYELEDSPVLDALITADMTTGPQGQRVSFGDRLGEILGRYGPETAVNRAMRAAIPELGEAVDRTARRLADADSASLL
jgi:hypothetical protein